MPPRPTRPRKRRIAIVLLLLLAACGESGFASVTCPDHGTYAGRCRAALQDLRYKRLREQQALHGALAQWQEDAQARRDYLVSFARPVRVQELLEDLEAHRDISVFELYLWAGAPGAVHPATGFRRVEDLGWPQEDAESIASELQVDTLDFLRQGIRGARRIESAESIREREAAVADVETHGVAAFGLRCECSLPSLVALSSRGFPIRAVEPPGMYQEPMWPEDRLRELIIATGGRYGRTG